MQNELKQIAPYLYTIKYTEHSYVFFLHMEEFLSDHNFKKAKDKIYDLDLRINNDLNVRSIAYIALSGSKKEKLFFDFLKEGLSTRSHYFYFSSVREAEKRYGKDLSFIPYIEEFISEIRIRYQFIRENYLPYLVIDLPPALEHVPLARLPNAVHFHARQK